MQSVSRYNHGLGDRLGWECAQLTLVAMARLYSALIWVSCTRCTCMQIRIDGPSVVFGAKAAQKDYTEDYKKVLYTTCTTHLPDTEICSAANKVRMHQQLVLPFMCFFT